MNYTLKELAHISAGFSFRGKIVNEPNGCAHALQMKDVSQEAGISWDRVVRTNLPCKSLEPSSESWLRKGDIIFTARGNNNYAYEIDGCPDNTVLSPHLFRLRILNSSVITPTFLAWQINQKYAQRYFLRSSEGSSIVGIRKAILEGLPIHVPSWDEQQRFSKMIRCWQEEKAVIIALKQNHEELMDTVAETILNQKKAKE